MNMVPLAQIERWSVSRQIGGVESRPIRQFLFGCDHAEVPQRGYDRRPFFRGTGFGTGRHANSVWRLPGGEAVIFQDVRDPTGLRHELVVLPDVGLYLAIRCHLQPPVAGPSRYPSRTSVEYADIFLQMV